MTGFVTIGVMSAATPQHRNTATAQQRNRAGFYPVAAVAFGAGVRSLSASPFACNTHPRSSVISPPGHFILPAGKFIWPSGETSLPAGKTTWPSGGIGLPADKFILPPGGTSLPAGEPILPPGKSVLPSGKTILPDAWEQGASALSIYPSRIYATNDPCPPPSTSFEPCAQPIGIPETRKCISTTRIYAGHPRPTCSNRVIRVMCQLHPPTHNRKEKLRK